MSSPLMMYCDDTDVPTPKTTVRLPGVPNPRDYRETFVLAQTLPPNPPPAPPVSRVAVCVWGWFGLGFRIYRLGPPKGEARHRVSPRSPNFRGNPA